MIKSLEQRFKLIPQWYATHKTVIAKVLAQKQQWNFFCVCFFFMSQSFIEHSIYVLSTKSDVNIHIGKVLVWFGLVLWLINYFRLFNTKSIFIHINSFILNSSVYHKYTVSMSKTVLLQIIQFSISKQFQCQKQFYFKQFSLA